MSRHSISKKILVGFLSLVMILMTINFPGRSNLKADKLNQSVFAFGESLTSEQKKKTADLLGVKEGSLEIQVNINELNDLLHDSYPYHQVYSSVYLDPKDADGVSVEIVSPETITYVTSTQYANAAITAGAVNMKIKVASVKAVDGSGALAGVYKAFRGTTGALSEENVKQAQEELEITAKISDDNKGKEGFSDELLNAAIAEIKAQIAKEKKENNSISDSTINNIIGNVINNYNLKGVLSEDDINKLSELMKGFSSIRLTDEQVDNLKKLGSRLLDSGQKLMDNVKSSWDNLGPENQSAIGSFFSSIFNAIANFFSGLFSK